MIAIISKPVKVRNIVSIEVKAHEKFSTLKDEMMKKYPGDSTPYILLAEIYQENGMIDEAIAQYLKVVTLNRNDPEIHQQLSNLFQEKGLLIEAEYEAELAKSLRMRAE